VITLRRGDERLRVGVPEREARRTFGAGPGFRSLVLLEETRIAPGAFLPVRVLGASDAMTQVVGGRLVLEAPPAADVELEAGACVRWGERDAAEPRLVNRSAFDAARVLHWAFGDGLANPAEPIESRHFAFPDRNGQLRPIASPDGHDGSFRMCRAARVFSAVMDPGRHLIHELGAGRGAWLHVAAGRLRWIQGILSAGDGAGFFEEAGLSITALEPSEILLFDLP
jgi:hypothetical protein